MKLQEFDALLGQDSYVRCIDKKRIDTAIVSMQQAESHLFSGGQIGWWVRTGYIIVDIDEGKEEALKVIKQQGGKVKGDDVVIKLQQPVAVRYEKAFEGHFPVEKRPINGSLKDELKYTFCGNGFVQKGSVLCEAKSYVAKVELYIDGKLVETANLPVANSTSIDDRRVDLFHRYQLEDKEHEVTLKCLNARDDAQIYVGDVLIYASQPRESHLLTK
mgnify:CR=1 FL=1